MNNRKLSSIAFASALGALGLVLACCSGSTDGGEGDFSGGQFVGSDANTGSMTLNVVDADMSVSDTSGFGVAVRDAQGRPVAGIKVSCDSESGVAILEPASGSESTSSSGDMSGVIGCAAPGSYQLACRLSVGSNKRKLVDVICRGPVPTGFTGFPGAGGGGLGGGTDGSDSGGVGGTDTDGIRMTRIVFDDRGGDLSLDANNFAIDVEQDVCDTTSDSVGAGTPTPTPDVVPEPFFDTILKVRVVNNTNQSIRFSSMTYRVLNAGALANTGSDFVSDTISFIGEASAVEGGGGSGEFTMLAFDAAGGDKSFFTSSAIPTSYGFKTVRVTLNGTNDSGDDVTISGNVTLNFTNYDNCGN